MAASLAFGLMLATFLVLLLIPIFYQVYMNVAANLKSLVSISETFGTLPALRQPIEKR
jgi:hypothetical protein